MFVGRWMFTHWPLTWSPCACSEMQAHLPVTLEEGKKWEGGGGGKKNMHWKVANYSHRNLTLADWLQPRSRRFCTWNSARCYFWDVTWWRNPRGSDRSRTLIQNPPHPPFPLPSLHLFLSLQWLHKPRPLWPTQRMWQQQNHAKHSRKNLCMRITLWRVSLADIQLMFTNEKTSQNKAEPRCVDDTERWDLNTLEQRAEIKQHDIPCLNNHGKILFPAASIVSWPTSPPLPDQHHRTSSQTSQDWSSDRGLGLKALGQPPRWPNIKLRLRASEITTQRHAMAVKTILHQPSPREGGVQGSIPGVTPGSHNLAGGHCARLNKTYILQSLDRQRDKDSINEAGSFLLRNNHH